MSDDPCRKFLTEAGFKDIEAEEIINNLSNQSNLDIIKGADVIIWTTTPWTIPANKALAYNASLKYVLLEINDNKNFVNRKIVIAKDLLYYSK